MSYTVKLMYLGLVDFTQDEDNFNGQIILERVSQANVLTCDSKHKNITEDVYINGANKKGNWKQLIVDSMTVGELKVHMQNN